MFEVEEWCARQESNLRIWLRRPALYPLSYGRLYMPYFNPSWGNCQTIHQSALFLDGARGARDSTGSWLQSLGFSGDCFSPNEAYVLRILQARPKVWMRLCSAFFRPGVSPDAEDEAVALCTPHSFRLGVAHVLRILRSRPEAWMRRIRRSGSPSVNG